VLAGPSDELERNETVQSAYLGGGLEVADAEPGTQTGLSS